ncbi:hypothetical protein Ccrd_004324 [Cynara cardunculus var. scolymus]|uniref:Uncharacterized protein n=1 Tax=Cynara cardunculus var. scolymus TaxID=59895 RepID=A0A118JVU9_CYNCS|nr:hypothetical protein Ccrd_004324 [Cynara cardunculus var. scolymus]
MVHRTLVIIVFPRSTNKIIYTQIEYRKPIAPISLKGDESALIKNSFVCDDYERPKVSYNKLCNEIQVISLKGISNMDGGGGVGSCKAEICEKIVNTCEN